MKYPLSFFLVMVLLSACSKDEKMEDKEPPVITITAPLNNQVYNAGETVNITATLNDNQKLTEVHVHISNRITGTLFIDIHRSPGSPLYNLNESFKTQAGVDYQIQVIVKDNSANESRSSIQITSN